MTTNPTRAHYRPPGTSIPDGRTNVHVLLRINGEIYEALKEVAHALGRPYAQVFGELLEDAYHNGRVMSVLRSRHDVGVCDAVMGSEVALTSNA